VTGKRPSATKRGYGQRWRIASKAFLARHPLCAMCEAAGRITLAEVVDHIAPHRNDRALFWDKRNWQSLCAHHHNSDKQRAEVRGYSNEVDPMTGLYKDKRHPSNR